MARSGVPLTGAATDNRIRNTALLFGSAAISMVGMNLVSAVTIMPPFMSHLTGSLVLVGAVPAVWYLSFALPQALGPGLYESKPVKKAYIARQLMAGSIALMAFGGLVVAVAEDHRSIVLALFFPAVLAFMGSMGLAHTAWIDVIGKVVDERVQSRFLRSSHAAGGLIGAAAIWMASRMIGDNAFPRGFGYSMVAAGGLTAAAASLFFFIKEQPSVPSGRVVRGFMQTIKGIPAVYRGDGALFRYVASRVVVAWGMSAFAFLTVYAVREMGATDADAVRLTAILIASQLIGSLAYGALGDRVSARWVPVCGSVTGMIALLFAFFAGSMAAVYLAISAAGLTVSVFMLAELSVILYLSPSERRPTYCATYSLTFGLLTVSAPLIAGVLVSAAGFNAMFGAAAVVVLAGIAMTAEFARASARRDRMPIAPATGG